ncbi:thiamine-phosphate kinase [Dethiobacter alkaliphilus]|uniref:thiamine-phosphate kinase n=1 Tax=Dethiobacter alkaliphilus TaxID=427926 RepID=UPI00222661C2|nr:thiamine-phosphate kinase [Dethiobacter alkaliphilus]MCW3490543.1 thiamine-phosphate kinase [Dethiobacter alkaliphilus]
MKIKDLGERALIKKIADVLGESSPANGFVGIGDDAALTTCNQEAWLVTSKDMLVEGVHFLLPAMTPADLGYKALAVNISDIAAMGGVPRHAYVALALPKETEVEFILEFYRGMGPLAAELGTTISGGDTVSSPGPLMISITVQGEVDRQKALLRSGASPGDILCTTGPLGASAAGLALLLNGNLDCPEKLRSQALDAHFRPVPRVREADFLAHSGAVTAAMDISDGLLEDLGEISQASGCGVLLEEDKIPVHPAAQQIAPLAQSLAADWALNGGEDYELLLAVQSQRFASLSREYESRFGVPLLPIGKVVGEKGLWMVTKEGKRVKLTIKGFQHF